MTSTQRDAIRKHGENLQAIFPATRDLDPVELCKKLRRIETRANQNAVSLCNGEIPQGVYDTRKMATVAKVNLILGNSHDVPVLINSDPRGYALKIDDAYMREHDVKLHRDMGGYGIIAPEIDKNGN